jgi:hypothetical protein
VNPQKTVSNYGFTLTPKQGTITLARWSSSFSLRWPASFSLPTVSTTFYCQINAYGADSGLEGEAFALVRAHSKNHQVITNEEVLKKSSREEDF